MASKRDTRRDLPRTAQCATVSARFPGGRHVCILENVSPRGACLAFNPDLPLPTSFELELAPGEFVPVVQAWRRGHRIGVRFLRAMRRPLSLEGAMAWLSDLQARIAA